jgi:hypothetical protein
MTLIDKKTGNELVPEYTDIGIQKLIERRTEVYDCRDNCSQLLDPDCNCSFSFLIRPEYRNTIRHLCEIEIK